MTRISRTGFATASAVAALSLVFTTGCTTKKYVASQTQPVIQKTNELDDATAANNRAIHDVDSRAQAGIQQAQSSANQAQQSAQNASQAANTAQSSAQDAVNRADSLAGVIANLDNYKQVGDVSVTFGFDKSNLNKAAKEQLDQFGSQLANAKNYILEVTGGTDSAGSKEYNYALSDRRAMAVVQYLASKYNVPAHKFYLVGLGKDVEVESNKTAEGRKKNRHVEVQLLSNAGDNGAPAQGAANPTGGAPSGR
ncbi:MAG TPA: OmpA family protein [Acidobacteriaceae bacterium]|nr:OmpA family protein [Acidobacteriaceae bacterium]